MENSGKLSFSLCCLRESLKQSLEARIMYELEIAGKKVYMGGQLVLVIEFTKVYLERI